ncbi:putative p-loop containing nucleoside triphosphate hydrolase protein [Diaporthe ampelina]|uniref:Putative p-loop containing nucleoside triphosphate hydrolase protein n=1 Tax=Diaporthe ampelina TaxID=1214573 RepID=A0A0G2I6E3_9PEZI|nr:putative p-loop containing nucleoside triphosphate hydrolase protein [Diaporthe ampelina]
MGAHGPRHSRSSLGRSANKAIQYVGFDAEKSGGGLGPATSAYLSARYESRREITDFSLKDYLTGNTELNPFALPDETGISPELLETVTTDLKLRPLLELPVAFLSNEGLRKYIRGVRKGGLVEDEKMPVKALRDMGHFLTESGITGSGLGEEGETFVKNAWADTFVMTAKLDGAAREKVDASLRWFEPELNPAYQKAAADNAADVSWASDYVFGEISFSAQRVLLFIRSMIKNPDIVVLDEAFSGMDEGVRDKCMLFLSHGEAKTFAHGTEQLIGREGSSSATGTQVVDSEQARADNVKVLGLSDQQALICISHIREEVPDNVREWLCLPEANSQQPARFGRLNGPLRTDARRWSEIWNIGRI